MLQFEQLHDKMTFEEEDLNLFAKSQFMYFKHYFITS